MNPVRFLKQNANNNKNILPRKVRLSDFGFKVKCLDGSPVRLLSKDNLIGRKNQ